MTGRHIDTEIIKTYKDQYVPDLGNTFGLGLIITN